MTETEARALVIRAGHRLTEAGLIARTWGNVSARLSDTQFVITPSGLAYDNLRPEQLVIVNIADCSYDPTEGKPSSEKGVHADAYQLRPEVEFVIHTHQDMASVVGVAGQDLTGLDDPLLGDTVPCAGYGMPSTKKLRNAVRAALEAHPDSAAVMMLRHGTLCLGRDMEHAFALADALEACCAARIGTISVQPAKADRGNSTRHGDRFCLQLGSASHWYDVDDLDLPKVAALHATIYRRSEVLCIRHETDAAVTAISCAGHSLRPWLDDLAQIAGPSIRCCSPDGRNLLACLSGRNAVLLPGQGALCTGATPEDVDAVCMILRKACRAQLYAQPGCKPLSKLDAALQRRMYLTTYSKQKEQQC